MKEYTTEEIFNELWKRIEYDANVSEELASESNELQARIDEAIKYIEDECLDEHKLYCHDLVGNDIYAVLDILKGSDKE